MTLEEMQDRIAELEAENARLKGERRKWRGRLPNDASIRWPFVRTRNVEQSLTTLVRSACFPLKTYDKSAVRKHEGIMTLLEMNDEQYSGYIDATAEILDILKKYRKIYFIEK